jgi:hypothetical protein
MSGPSKPENAAAGQLEAVLNEWPEDEQIAINADCAAAAADVKAGPDSGSLPAD